MPRAWKDEISWLPGHYDHLYNRGARRDTIFLEEQNDLFVLHRVKHYCTTLRLTMIANDFTKGAKPCQSQISSCCTLGSRS